MLTGYMTMPVGFGMLVIMLVILGMVASMRVVVLTLNMVSLLCPVLLPTSGCIGRGRS